MAIRIECKCGKAYQVKEEHVGRKAKCGHCGAQFVIPETDPTASTVVKHDCPEDHQAIKNWTIITGPEAERIAKEQRIARPGTFGAVAMGTLSAVAMKRKRKSPSTRLKNIQGTLQCPSCTYLTPFDIVSMSSKVACTGCDITYSLFREYFKSEGVPAIVLAANVFSQPSGASASPPWIDISKCKEIQVESAAPRRDKKEASYHDARRLRKKQNLERPLNRDKELTTDAEFPWIVTRGLGCRIPGMSRDLWYFTHERFEVHKVRIKIPRRGKHVFRHKCKHCGKQVTIAAMSHETSDRRTFIIFICLFLVSVCVIVAGIIGLATGDWSNQPNDIIPRALVFPTLLTIIGGIGTLLFGLLSISYIFIKEADYIDEGYTYLPDDSKEEEHKLRSMSQWESSDDSDFLSKLKLS